MTDRRMTRRRWMVILAGLAWLLGGCTVSPTPTAELTETSMPTVTQTPPPAPLRIVGYYPGWRRYEMLNIDASGLTHVNYAFANIIGGRCIVGDSFADLTKVHPGDTGDQLLRGNFHQLELLKERYPHLKVLISVGGWTWSGGFSDAALTEESRQEFVQSCIDVFIRGEFGEEHGTHPGIFDGIDIDWEFPVQGGLNDGRPEDKRNFTLLLAEFRRQLDELGVQTNQHYPLTVAVGATPQRIEDTEVAEFQQYLDYANLMTYDFHGGWDNVTNFNAPLYFSSQDPSGDAADLNVDAAVQNYLEAGLPADKLVIGVPFYGRSWTGVPEDNDGLYQSAADIGPGTSERGVLNYSDIVKNYEPVYERFFQPEAQVPWLYNGKDFITYDDPQTIATKAAYVREHNLSGIMIWELTCDLAGIPAPQNSLLAALYNALLPGNSPTP